MSTFVSNGTIARVPIHMVVTCASMSTRVAGTFVDI